MICTHPGNNATCVQEGAVATTTPPVKLTCEQCFTKFLSSTQLSALLIAADVTSPEQLCATLSRITQADFVDFLITELVPAVPPLAALQLLQCLIDAGVQFSTDTGPIIR